MEYVPCARTVSSLIPAALEGGKQSRAICAYTSCVCPRALGSFPEIQVQWGCPKGFSPFSLQLPLQPLCSCSFGGVPHPWCSSSILPSTTHPRAASPILLGQSGEGAFTPAGLLIIHALKTDETMTSSYELLTECFHPQAVTDLYFQPAGRLAGLLASVISGICDVFSESYPKGRIPKYLI